MNPFEMIKNISTMKGKIKKLQSELDTIVFTATNLDNTVSATVNGKLDLVELKVNPSWAAVNSTLVQTEIKNTVQSALDGIKIRLKDYAKEMTGGMDLSQFGINL